MPLPPAKVQSVLTRLLAGAVLLSGKRSRLVSPLKGLSLAVYHIRIQSNPNPVFLMNPDQDPGL
jgi:hypothetical protein